MANEITNTVTLSCSKNGVTTTTTTTTLMDLDGNGQHAAQQVVGTTSEALSLPADLTDEGVRMIVIKNISAAAVVTVSLNSGAPPTQICGKIVAGAAMNFAPYDPNTFTYYLTSDTASTTVEVVAVGT